MPTRTIGLLAIVGGTFQVSGGAWDVSWHIDQGRESFWSPPHLLLYCGVLLVLSAVFLTLLRGGGWRSGPRQPSVLAAGLATLLQLAAAPFDEIWHRLYGIDTTVWSPPHLVLILGGSATMFALAMFCLAHERGATDRWLATVLAGLAILYLGGVVAEWEFPNIPRWHASQQRPAWSYPVTSVLVQSVGLLAVARLLGRRGATKTTLVVLVIRFGLSLVLAGRRSPLLLPALLLPSALALDALLSGLGHGGSLVRRSLINVVGGILIATSYLLIEPVWRTIVPGWPGLMNAMTANWPVILIAGGAGGLIGGAIGEALRRFAGISYHDGTEGESVPPGDLVPSRGMT